MMLIPIDSSVVFAEVTFYLKSKNKGQYFLLCNGVTFWSVTCTFYKVLKFVTFNSTGCFFNQVARQMLIKAGVGRVHFTTVAPPSVNCRPVDYALLN